MWRIVNWDMTVLCVFCRFRFYVLWCNKHTEAKTFRWLPLWVSSFMIQADKEMQESSETMCELQWFLKEKWAVYLDDSLSLEIGYLHWLKWSYLHILSNGFVQNGVDIPKVCGHFCVSLKKKKLNSSSCCFSPSLLKKGEIHWMVFTFNTRLLTLICHQINEL